MEPDDQRSLRAQLTQSRANVRRQIEIEENSNGRATQALTDLHEELAQLEEAIANLGSEDA